MIQIGWKTFGVLALLIAGGVALIALGNTTEGASLTGAGVLIALALFGVVSKKKE